MRREAVREKAEEAAEARLLDALVGKYASEATRSAFRQRFRDGHLTESEVEIEVEEAPNMPLALSGMGGGQIGMITVGDMLGKMGKRNKGRRQNVPAACAKLIETSADLRVEQDEIESKTIANDE